ncbi:MAG: DUF1853 family protein [Halioglobus sp.]|nr:DUF1853 family protein [Halioglobus sp.]
MRDLAWACFSQPLIHCSDFARTAADPVDCKIALTAPRRAWLASLDADPQPLHAHLEARGSRRLGMYYEGLWHFLLRNDPALELVAHNQPVQHDGRTIGEFDCLYFCRERNCHVHLELTVKYYLGYPVRSGSAAPSTQWLGPNTRDRLHRKLRHLLEKQSRLADQPGARAVLAELGIDTLQREIAFRGYLFQPPAPLPYPQGHNRHSVSGSWLRIGELRQALQDMPAATFLPLPRLRWLSPAVAAASDRPQAGGEIVSTLRQRLARKPVPVLLAALDDAGAEQTRLFVTPDDWPHL